MNLVTDPWLPVTNKKNGLNFISLEQLFAKPNEWQDLVLRPHERVSVMRLLICIVQAALDGPASIDDWHDALSEIPVNSLKYLNRWCNNFNLYDEEKPFLQIADLKPGNEDTTGPSIAKLDSTLAVGDNATTLFDHRAASAIQRRFVDRIIDDKKIVISLVTFLNYSPSGIQSSAILEGNLIKHNSGAADAPCANQDMLHTFVIKNNLISTIHSNLVDKELVEEIYGENSWGKPVWEIERLFSLNDDSIYNNSVNAYLGRLTPLSRFCKLIPNSPYFIYCKGFQYSTKPKKKNDSKRVYIDFKPEPSSTVIINAKGNHSLMKSGVNIPWREITSFVSKRQKNSYGGALPLRYLTQSDSFDLIVLGQMRDSQNAAKIIDLIESKVHIPAYMMDSDKQKAYEHNIANCINRSFSLFKAVEKYRTLIDGEWKNLMKKVFEKKTSEVDRKRRFIFRKNTLNHYWTLIEKQRHLLMNYISLLGTEKDLEREEARKSWQKAVNRAVTETYQVLCPQEKPRQIKAYVAGWQVLYPAQSQNKEEA